MSKIYPIFVSVNQSNLSTIGLQSINFDTVSKLTGYLKELKKIEFSPDDDLIYKLCEYAKW